MSQAAFGDALGLAPGYVYLLEKGRRNPSDRTIADVVRKFKVNDEWLRTGSGPMWRDTTRESEIADALHGAVRGKGAKNRVLRVLALLPEDTFPAVEQMIQTVAESLREEKTGEQP